MSDTSDNLEAAMAKVAETITPARRSDAKGDDAYAKQVLFRANDADHDRWKQAAEKLGISLSEFIRECCNAKASELLDCQHPLNQRRWYPWAEICTKCGFRIRNEVVRKAPKAR